MDLPVTMTMTRTGIPGFGYHHAMTTYLTWLRAYPNLSLSDFWSIGAGRFPTGIVVNSPVDVRVYNSQGQLAGEIVNNIAKQDTEVFAWVNEDGSKQFFLPYGDTFTVRFTATDSGTMTFLIETVDVLIDTPHAIRTFENVVLYTGRQFVSEIVDTPEVRLLVVENGQAIVEVGTDGTETRLTTPVTGITIAGNATRNLTAGQTLQLSATVTPATATNHNVTWSSSNTAVATVNANGLVTARAGGTTTITVRTADGNRTAQVTVNVTAPVIAVTGVTIAGSATRNLTAGQTLQLSATVTPSNATNRNVTWSSSNTAVATSQREWACDCKSWRNYNHHSKNRRRQSQCQCHGQCNRSSYRRNHSGFCNSKSNRWADVAIVSNGYTLKCYKSQCNVVIKQYSSCNGERQRACHRKSYWNCYNHGENGRWQSNNKRYGKCHCSSYRRKHSRNNNS